MKKVLFTAHVDSHILQFHLPYLKMFKEHGYEVHVATNGNEEIPYCDVKHVVSFERSPFKINNLRAIKQLRKIIDEEKFDIIHTHTPMGAAVTRLAAKKARKKFKTRVIYTAHGLHFFKGSSFINWLVFYPVEKYLSKYTDTLILINQEDYDLCKKKFKKCHDIHFIKGVGIDKNKMNITVTNVEKKELLKSLGLSEKDFIIIYPAELSKRKRQVWLINSIKDLLYKYKDIKLLLPGKDSLNGELSNLIKKLKLEDQVLLLGYRKDIPKLLRISNLSISTANQEGLPVNIMEAMYVGLPIVVTDCRGNRDLITNTNHSSIVSLEDSEEFSKSIEKIYFKNHDKKYDYNIDDIMLDTVMEDYKKIYFKKKKVLHVLASNIYSGAENVCCTIINNLKNEFDMYYCSPIGNVKNKLAEFNISYCPIKKLSYFELKKVIKNINPDIIHAHDYKASCMAGLLISNQKFISHIHCNNEKVKNINFNSLFYKFISKKITHSIWVSNSSYDAYVFNKDLKDRKNIIYNIIDAEKVKINSAAERCDKKYDLMYLGRINYQKNVDRFIEIIKIIVEKKENLKVALVGDGDERDIVLNLIEKYGLEDNIDMLGYVSNPYPILKNSKILCLTSRFEGTPMCALESLSLGIPVVSTPVDGMKDLIKNDINGFLTGSNNKYASKVLEYLENNSKYSALKKNVINMFNDYNNLDKYKDKIRNLYND